MVQTVFNANGGRLASVQSENSKDDGLISYLYPLKGLAGEDIDAFEMRWNSEFDALNLPPVDSMIDIPTPVPDKCTDAKTGLDVLEAFKIDLERELRFKEYNEIALETCCEDAKSQYINQQTTAENKGAALVM